MLSRESILAAVDLRREAVSMPEWGGSVYVRIMSCLERAAFESAAASTEDNVEKMLTTVLACCCDEAGVLLFSEADRAALRGKSAGALLRLTLECLRVNAMTQEEVDTLKKT